MAKRRTELTRELVDAYCRVLDKTTPAIAASAVGVSAKQMQAWLEAGQDVNCTDETLLYLAEREGAVQAGGTRGRILASLIDAAEVEPRIALEVAKMLMPSLTAPKQVELTAKVNVAPAVDYSKLSDDELKVLQDAETIRLRLTSGDV